MAFDADTAVRMIVTGLTTLLPGGSGEMMEDAGKPGTAYDG